MSEELKKVAADAKIELNDDDLESVAGGYSKATWKSMSYDERVKAKQESDAYRTLKMYCKMDDPNI